MSFNSLQFLIFLPIVLIVYWIVPHKFRWVPLLIASYYFYMSWNPQLIFLIVGTTLISYLGGLLIPKAKTAGGRKAMMISCVSVCLAVLIVFKYLDFLLGTVYSVIRWFTPKFEGRYLDLILPIGISFYTFQTLSYVIDVYRGTIEPEKHFGYYALFVSFFPQLVAGPIERPDNLIPQLRAKHKINISDFDAGFRYLLSGFIKKVVVADYIGTIVDAVYTNIPNANGMALFFATMLFFVQVYCDFSGYSDIALGCARMMGIRLMQNFNRPFMATSMHDFWKRWHISLSKWFNDYVYFPLGGSRKGKGRAYLNMLIVFALSGLWHGASWTFVLWGLSAALFQTVERFIRKPLKRFSKKTGFNFGSSWMLWIRRFLVLLCATASSVFFRSADLAQAGEVYSRIFTEFFTGGVVATLNAMNLTSVNILLLVGAIALMNVMWRLTVEEKNVVAAPLAVKDAAHLRAMRSATYFAAIVVIALAWFIMISGDAVSPFVYFQF